jgi:hypothetical protein
VEPSVETEEDQPTIHQLIYASAATAPFDDERLAALLSVARANNERDGLSGMLVYEDGSFLQVLEGEREVVDALYAKIEQDDRHGDSMVLLRSDRTEREFGEWTMAWARPPRKVGEKLPGWDDFLHGGFRSGSDLDGARALKLLYAFRDKGRYHR